MNHTIEARRLRTRGAVVLAVLTALVAVGLAPAADAGGVPALTAVLEADQTDAIAGEPVNYQLTVSNTGAVPLTSLTIAYSGTPDCDQTIDDLAVGEEEVVGCSYSTSDVDVGTFANQATVSSTQTGPVTSNTWSVAVNATVTSLSGSLSADETSILAGAPVHYHATVENTGNLSLSGVRVSVPAAVGCGVVGLSLGVGEDYTLDCEYHTVATDVGTLSNVAVFSSDQTDETQTNPFDVTVTTEQRPGPDVKIGRERRPRIGNDVYATLGYTQSVDAHRLPGEAVTFYAVIQNDGVVAERFRVRLTRPRARSTRVQYFLDDSDVEITRSMTAGTYRTRPIEPSESVIIRLEVTVRRTAAIGSMPTIDLRAKSSRGDRPSDTVRAIVRVYD